MRFQHALTEGHGQGEDFTIDFTFYKVLIIMLMSLMFMVVVEERPPT